MSKCRFLLALIIAPSLAVTPIQAHASTSEAQASDQQQIVEWATVWKRHFEAGDTEKLRDMYEPDAVLMANGAPPQIGVEAILSFLGRNKAAGNKVTIDFANEDIIIDGKTGYLTAKYWMTIQRPDYPPFDLRGRSFLVFSRGDDGHWRLWRDMDNKAPDVRAEDRPVR